MNILYQSVKFKPENIMSTYARRYSNGEVKMYDVDAKHKTIREWWTTLDALPADTVAKLSANEGRQILVSGLTMQERERAS